MNPNMSIYKRLNSKPLVQVELGLGLLHWANICLKYISNILNVIPFKKKKKKKLDIEIIFTDKTKNY